jgi:hypothetical protein
MAKRYSLDGEIERLTRLTGRLGRRLEYNLRAPRSAGEPETKALPSEEWRQLFGEYTSALRALEHGHGERVKRRLLAERSNVRPPMTDEQFEREIRALGAQVVLNATEADIETWLAARAAARQDKAAPRGRA